MGISNLATGLRPGVCTSTTRPSSPFEGQMIYETDTNRVLVWDNAAWVMIADTDQPPGLQLITSASFSSIGTSGVNLESVFDNNVYFNYRLIVQITSASTTNRLRLRMLSGTTQAQSGGYYSGGIAADFASNTTFYMQRSNNDNELNISQTTNANSRMITLDIFAPNQATATLFSGTYIDGTGINSFAFGGGHNVGTAYDGINLGSSGGTLSGNYQLYGYRK